MRFRSWDEPYLIAWMLTARLQINLIHILSLMTAVISTLRFYKVLKADLAGHKPLSKLFAFKLMVGLNFLMNVSDI